MTRLLFLDHEDSFSANLVAALSALGAEVDVLTVERGAGAFPEAFAPLLGRCEGVVLSPGPGHPQEHPATVAFCKALLAHPAPPPLLGVCLGLQCVAFAAGANVRRLETLPVHGRRFKMNCPFTLGGAFGATRALGGHVTLHNSLCVRADDAAFRARFRIVAEAENAVLVAVSKQAPWLLCQFHPESFGSTAGLPFLEAFVSRVSSPKATSL